MSVRSGRSSAWLVVVGWLIAAPSAGSLRADDGQGPPLPPRAQVRISTDDLRMATHVASVAFSPDGRRIAAGDARVRDARVGLFDVRTGRRIRQLRAPDGRGSAVLSVAFSPDGTKLLCGESLGAVALWDLSGDRLLFRGTVQQGPVEDLAFSPDGRLIATAGDEVIRVRRVENPAEVVRELADPQGPAPRAAAQAGARHRGVACLAFTPDGTRIVAGKAGRATPLIWRVEDGRFLGDLPAANHPHGLSHPMNYRLNTVAVTPDGRQILSIGRTVVRDDPTVPETGDTLDLHGFEGHLGVDDRRTVSAVKSWDIATGALVAAYRGDAVYYLGCGAVSRDGRRVAVGELGRLRILDADTGRAERIIDLPGWLARRPAFSPDGAVVAVPIDNAIGIFEVATGRRLLQDAGAPVGSPVSAAWAPSGDRIVTGHHDGYVRAWDAATGKLIWHKLLAPVVRRGGWSANPAFVTFLRDGRRIIAAGRREDPDDSGQTGIVAVYEAETGRTVREVALPEIVGAALAPDDRMLVVFSSHAAYSSGHFLGIELATGRTRWTNPSFWDEEIPFHAPAALHFEAKPPWFRAALIDGDVIRFNALTGHEQRRFLADAREKAGRRDEPEPDAAVLADVREKAGRRDEPERDSAVFSADGCTLATCRMQTIHVWDVEAGALRREIRRSHHSGSLLALAPDGRTLAAADTIFTEEPGEDTIRLYDVATGQQVLALEPGDDRAVVMAFSPDGTRLFTGFDRGTAIIWDVQR